MGSDVLAWGAAAVVLLAGGAFDLGARGQWGRPRAARCAGLIAIAVALVLALGGLAWRSWRAGAWPGTAPADALALMGCGALILMAWDAAGAWQARRAASPALPWPVQWGGSAARRDAARASNGAMKLAVALLLAAAAALAAAAGPRGGAEALRSAAQSPALWQDLSSAAARSWLLGLRNGLAGLGLGGWLAAAAASVAWGLRELSVRGLSRLHRPEAGEPGPAGDAGRSVALLSYPWLTAACLAAAGWQLATNAALWRAAPADLWLMATWLLGAAHLHATSTWRPLRLPAWAPALLAAGAASAALLAALTARSLLG